MSSFFFNCRVCGDVRYEVDYGPDNGIIGPGYYRPIVGLICNGCRIRYAIIPPDPARARAREMAEAQAEEFARLVETALAKKGIAHGTGTTPLSTERDSPRQEH